MPILPATGLTAPGHQATTASRALPEPGDTGREAEDVRGAEFELIAKLRERLERAPGERSALAARIDTASGDDAAVTVPAGATATSVDVAIEGVHFRLETAPARSVGHKALAAALSDLAAMGAAAGEAYVQLGLPDGFGEEACLELADGLADVAGRHGVAVLGGDISRAPALIVAVTVVGHAQAPEALVRRSGAREDDVICVTGQLGGAAAGLLLLEQPDLAGAVSDPVADALRARQLEPEPLLAAGVALARAEASAMIDVSDGLGADAGHVARASGVALEIEADRIPLATGVDEIAAAAGIDPLELAAGGGEDYELLVALAPEAFEAAASALAGDGIELRRIGRAARGTGVVLLRGSGSELEAEGFDQLRAPRPR